MKKAIRCFHSWCRYVEPPSAVPVNNELAAARGEMYAAEEAVLWKLTGRVADEEAALQETLDKVREGEVVGGWVGVGWWRGRPCAG